MNKKSAEKQVMKILEGLLDNAAQLKAKISEGDLAQSASLVGKRVALIEALRELRDAKVSIENSDIKSEMSLVVNNIQRDVYEAIGGINARLSSLLSELAKVRSAKGIAAYKIQGGRYGY